MTTYDIKRWDVIMQGNGIERIPILYIKPDQKLIDTLKHNQAVFCEINGTKNGYEGRGFPALVSPSLNIPNYRPIFWEKYGWYVVALAGDWGGYPYSTTSDLGKVKITVAEEYLGNHHDEPKPSDPPPIPKIAHSNETLAQEDTLPNMQVSRAGTSPKKYKQISPIPWLIAWAVLSMFVLFFL